jgi:hypothetical protein
MKVKRIVASISAQAPAGATRFYKDGAARLLATVKELVRRRA